MDNTEAREWAQSFENKSVSELRAMVTPEGLDDDADLEWRRAKVNAIFARQDADRAAQDLPASPMERARLLLDEMHDAELRARECGRAAQIPLTLPDGDAALLLEKQIASSAALIGYLSNYVARNDTDPSVCMSFMDRMTAMLGASANVGKVVGRLRGQVSRTEQYINVNRMEGERGRG